MGLSGNVGSTLTWMFLPAFLSSTLLSFFYRVCPTRRPRLPANPTPALVEKENERARRHSRNSRILNLGTYLIWTTLSTYFEQGRGASANYYTLLGLSRAVVEQDVGGGAGVVKSRWRKLARVYHPDKVGKQGEAFFVELKRAVDVLESDGKRWAYERFGPGVTEWGTKLVTHREFLTRGIQRSIGYYIVALLSIAALSFFRRQESALSFWRYLTLALMLSAELTLVMRPSPSSFLAFLLPNRLPFEHIEFLRQLSISTSIGMSQLAPLLHQDPSDQSATDEQAAAGRALADAEALKPLLQRLANLTAEQDAECDSAQFQELLPFLRLNDQGSTESERAARLKAEQETVARMKERLVGVFADLKMKTSEETRDVWRQAVQRGAAQQRQISTVSVSSTPKAKVSMAAATPRKADTPGKPSSASKAPVPSTPVKTSARLPKDIPLPPSPPDSDAGDFEEDLSSLRRSFPDATMLQSPPPEL